MASALVLERLAGFAMGMWLLSTAAANYIGGVIAGIASVPAGTGAAAGAADLRIGVRRSRLDRLGRGAAAALPDAAAETNDSGVTHPAMAF